MSAKNSLRDLIKITVSGFTCVVLLSSCAAGKQITVPDAPTVAEDSFVQADFNRFEKAEPVADWWKVFDDPRLAELVEEALRLNLDVRIALANMARARAKLAEVKADRYPTVGADARYGLEFQSHETSVGPFPKDRSSDIFDAGFDSFWQMDLFGRVSQRIELAKALDRQAEADLQGIYVTVAAEVARYYMELRGAQHRLNIARRNADNQKKTHSLILDMSQSGRGTNRDVARALTQLELTRATIPPLEAQVSASIHRLSVLTGRPPLALREDLEVVKPLPSVPHSISIGDPRMLLRRRPDIRFAEEELAAAAAQYHLSVAELFPDVTISGSIGFLSASLARWMTYGALTADAGPTIRWRILEMHRVRAEIRQSDAETQGKLAAYEKAVLEALEEMQTALTNFSREEERRQNLIEAARSSEQASRLARSRFEAGLDSFLDILDTERVQLQAEDALAVSEISSALKLVAIYKALGGGWQVVPDPDWRYRA